MVLIWSDQRVVERSLGLFSFTLPSTNNSQKLSGCVQGPIPEDSLVANRGQPGGDLELLVLLFMVCVTFSSYTTFQKP